jgi:Flp pilus assembly protein TadD
VLEALIRPGAPQEQAVDPEKQAALYLAEADRCRQRRDWSQAAAACEKAVAAKPDFVEGIMVWADVLIEQGQAAAAVGVIARLAALDPNSSKAHNYLGLVQSKAGQWAGAGDSFRRAVDLEPSFADAIVNLGVWAWEQGRDQEALGHFKRASQLDPANRELVANLALLQQRAGQPAEAVAVLRHYLSGHPADAELQGLLAEALAIAEQQGGKKEQEG